MTNSSGKCNFTAIDSLAKTLQLWISIPTFSFGLILNALALFVFCCLWKKQTKTSIYMINLAFADLLLLLSLPLKLYYSKTAAPGLLCSFIESLYFVNTYGSIFIIACITVDRYIRIRDPFEGRANQSPKWAVLICCLIWAVAWACSSPMYVFHKKEPFPCFHNMSEQAWSVPFIASLEIIGFLIPLAVVLFCSAQNIRILLNHESQAKKEVEGSSCLQEGSSCLRQGSSCLRQGSSSLRQGSSSLRQGSSSLRAIIINLVVFLVCFTPVHVAICLQCLVRQHVIVDCSQKQRISLFIQVSMILANLNCCLDAIVYYFIAEEFREKIHLENVIKLCPFFRPHDGTSRSRRASSSAHPCLSGQEHHPLTQQDSHCSQGRESTEGQSSSSVCESVLRSSCV